MDPAAMLQEWSENLAGLRAPDLGGMIPAGGDNKLAVVAECRIQHRVGMTSKFPFDFPGTKIPDASDVVLARSDDSRTVGAENSRENRVRMRQR